MSTQSIIDNNIEYQKEYFEKRNLDLGQNFLIYKRFMIGKPVDFNEMMFVKTFHKLLCTDNCELIDWIDKKIKGKLNKIGIKINKKPTISDLFKIYQQQVEACSVTNVTSECCNWEQIKW